MSEIYESANENNIVLDLECEPINYPIGAAGRKYGRIWEAFAASIMFGVGCLSEEDDPFPNHKKVKKLEFLNYETQLMGLGLRSQTRITNDNLEDVFGGLITDWDYLIKILDAFKKAKYSSNVDKAFTYSIEQDGSIIIRLKSDTCSV